MDITKEMFNHFMIRTIKHITRVIKNAEILRDNGFIDIVDKAKLHDSSKFEPPEVVPYIYLSWQKETGVYLPPDIWNEINKATLHHIKNNKHHPEFWDKNFNGRRNFNKENRDGIPPKPVDGKSMPQIYLAEMCCDWQAMSQELGTNVWDWSKSVINRRWLFTDTQVKFINDCLMSLNKDK